MPRKIIGLAGKKHSGKSTLAKMLGEEVMSFSDPIKEALVAMGLTRNLFYEPELKDIPHALLSGKTPRYVMQTLGTEWGRNLIGPEFWVNLLKEKVKRTHGKAKITVDDVRFASELYALQDLGADIYYIERPSLISTDTHSSESLKPKDFELPIVFNTGTPEQLLEAFNAIRGT